ncbi:hypothetical protein H5410_064215 [Solanum commersonii]|uniref:Uncharacterized protein n=1 Tax=Solanum commersonii TaxID=4109 RepID=A0A9J5W008_SOLCO|nr:hypothetical protein H5410_064215 [Solanum commersonii]
MENQMQLDEKVFLIVDILLLLDNLAIQHIRAEPLLWSSLEIEMLLYTLYQPLYPHISMLDKDIPSRSEMDFNLNDT